MTPQRLQEVRALTKLAWPLVIAQLAQMAMGVVGTVAAGRLGVDALAAQALAATTFVLLLVTAYGAMSGLDPHVARSLGAEKPLEAARFFRQGLWLAVLLGLPLTGLLWLAPWLLAGMGQDPKLLPLVTDYLHISSLGLLPAMGYSVYRSFFSAVGQPKAVMIAAVAANVLNAVLAFAAVDAGFGLPAVAWVSVLSRVVLLAIVVVWGQLHPAFAPYRHGFESIRRDYLVPLLRSGLPLGVQYGLEVTGFVLVTLWMGLLGAETLAAHEVALSCSSVAFQVPFSTGTAAAMRVGRAVGRQDPAAVRLAGSTAFALGLGFALVAGVAMAVFRLPMARLYMPTASAEVLAMTGQFLLVAAAFQLADSAQAVGFGVLRGLNDTRMPVLFNLLGFFVLGLPLGWLAVFEFGWSPLWLWYGLSLALAVVAVALGLRFHHLTAKPLTAKPLTVQN